MEPTQYWLVLKRAYSIVVIACILSLCVMILAVWANSTLVFVSSYALFAYNLYAYLRIKPDYIRGKLFIRYNEIARDDWITDRKMSSFAWNPAMYLQPSRYE